MKNKVVRCLAATLIVMIAGGTMAACSANGENSNSNLTLTSTSTEAAEATGTNTDVGPLEPFAESVTISVAQRTFGDATPTGDESPWNQMYAEYGINIETAWSVDAGQFNDRLNTAIASGDVPDIFQVSASSHMNNLVRAGMVADLTDVFEKYASPLVKEMFATDAGKAALEAATFDGKLCFIPINITESINDMDLLYIREDWVANLGMEMPASMEEVKELAIAFTHNDPDGNGQDDTYGLAIQGRDGINAIRSFFTGFGVFPGQWHDGMLFYQKDDAGNVIWSGEQPGMIDGLQMLQDMYKEGAIVQDFANYDGTMASEDLNGGKAGMAIGARGYPAWFVHNTYANNPDAKWFAMRMPAAQGQSESLLAGFQPLNAAIAVSATCENPEAVIKMLNLVTEIHDPNSPMFDPALHENNRTTAGDAFMVPIKTPAAERVQTLAIADAYNNQSPDDLDAANRAIYDNIVLFEESGDASAWSDWNRFKPEAGRAYYVIYGINGDAKITRNLWQNIPTAQMQSQLSVWKNMVDEAIIRIVSGEDVNEWNTVIEQWNSLGGDDFKEQIK